MPTAPLVKERVPLPRRPRPIRTWHLPAQAPPPTVQAAARQAQFDHHLVQQLGALPLLVPTVKRLKLRETVNQHGHPQAMADSDLDLGRVVEVVVFNRLLAPRPLVHVEGWLAQTALPELLGPEAAQCNDDRLARTLDALGPHLDTLWQDRIVGAVSTFQLDLSQLAYDITSVSFCGEYDDADLITFGDRRDHRPDRKQLELATTVTIDGGIPLDDPTLAGNVADRTTPVANLPRLQRLLALLPPRTPTDRRPLVVGDRAMLTAEVIAADAASDLRFLGRLDPSLVAGAIRALLESITTAELEAAPLAYRPQRTQDDPDWEPYHGVLRVLDLPHPEASRPPRQVRALVVWSPGKARLDAQLRATHLTRLAEALTALAGKLGRRPDPTRLVVEKRVATLLRRHPARSLSDVQIDGGTDAAPL